MCDRPSNTYVGPRTPVDGVGHLPGWPTPPRSLACNPISYSHQPKGPEERYQHQRVQLGVAGLLGVFWDSRDQLTNYTVALCLAPCGWCRAHFFHCSYEHYDYCITPYKKWESVMHFPLTSIYRSRCCYAKLLRCVMLWLDGWFCLPNAPDVMVVVLQCVFTLRRSDGPTTIMDGNETRIDRNGTVWLCK